MVHTTCALCGSHEAINSKKLGVCLECLRRQPAKALPLTAEAHSYSRRTFGLPEIPPRAAEGKRCGLCDRQCIISEDERGYCGLRIVRDGRIFHLAGTPARGLLHWYPDPLPTNCVADWVCQGHSQLGYHNLAVFYSSCTLNCLFCQNWHFRCADPMLNLTGRVQTMSAAELAACANERTYCVCFFGGDPSSQMPHAMAVGRQLANRGVSVCWETNGTMHPRFLRKAVELSLLSGGCIKFDLKAFDPNLHLALTGASNTRTLENFATAAERIDERPNPPLVVTSTLLVPGYIDAEEVGKIAQFIANINPDIPYSLLGFYPNFYMDDLPCTSSRHASEALEAAHMAGLRNVRLGNVQLLSKDY
jgi:pyruvate formate lyase activating enzyme